MLHPGAAAGFALAILPLVATPGASLALLLQQVTGHGRRRALPVVLGTATGLYAHAGFALAGLSALVTGSERGLAAVRLAGAAYLVGLGVLTWRGPRATAADRPRPRVPESPYLQALLANVLNPKAASVYLTLVPQFLSPERPLGGQLLVLTTVHATLIALWLLGWALLAHRAADALRHPRLATVMSRTTAIVLILLGIRTAVLS